MADITSTISVGSATSTLQSAFTLPGHSDPDGVAPNYAKQTYSSNGTPKETNPPNSVSGAPNSSPQTQMNGSSLPKQSQGIVYKTTTELNSVVAACDIKLPTLFTKLNVNMTLIPAAWTSQLNSFATWIGSDVISPIVSYIKGVIRAIKAKIKKITDKIKWLKKQLNTIKEWITAAQELISFIMSLPAKLMQLVANCLAKIQSSLISMVKNQVNALTETDKASNQASTDPSAQTPDQDSLPDIPTVQEAFPANQSLF